MAYCLGGLAELAMLDGDGERAATMLGASEQLFREIGAAPDPDESRTQQKISAYASETLGAEKTAELRAAGAALTAEELAAAI